MKFKLLTINNITKICDDNLYLTADKKPTQFQWYDFQLEFALKNLESSLDQRHLFHPFTNFKLTRSEILELILRIYGTTVLLKPELNLKYAKIWFIQR